MAEEKTGGSGEAQGEDSGIRTRLAKREVNIPGLSRLGKQRLRRIAKNLAELTKTPRYQNVKASLSIDLNARKLAGGKATFVEYVRSAAKDNPELEAFIFVWDYLPQIDREKVTLDMVCDASGLPRKLVLGFAAAESCALGNDVANLIMGDGMEKVTRAAVRAASRLDGHDDRRMIFTARGMMPVSKGATFVNNVSQAQIVKPPTGDDFEDTILEVSATSEEFTPDT